MSEKSLWVIIPAYNEEKHITKVIRNTKKYCSNIVVVDDGSRDKTYSSAVKGGAIALKHVVNLGKGAAVKTGADYAVANGAKTLIFMDSDGQHEPKEIPNFVKALKGVDIIYGSRRRSKKMPVVFRFGNYVLNGLMNLIYGMNISDTQSGYRALTSSAYQKVRWSSNDYRMESEMIVNAGKNNLKYKEIFIRTLYSDDYKGTTAVDGVKIALHILWWKISR
ncbi:glycosyltransferase family 2 protein [Candidatus Woesearchaeota archaeon]|jgi:UDP-N-acetylglucosamine---dolichyl-phosphate N-acetylglucosaminyltransferase|nr:glycosyltransferase family 2 protein [Candidatus Woesearchaeota archaeon]MBT3538455.1 glycosyltransferase family 2 protein [Candidatus Woesearchaeota archaeon]MBT4697018.1 glycosyltransferase family 2 protein [Candidatus Woesearchaeota archaeon]MBT7106089.1 glycosyltransferase family 2 protein [Candidatus Woesearchaeota archaeon]MBT7931013.1 glycosyltransferase family 2 protein [Candidatus Woesearchaeota archaeon]